MNFNHSLLSLPFIIPMLKELPKDVQIYWLRKIVVQEMTAKNYSTNYKTSYFNF